MSTKEIDPRLGVGNIMKHLRLSGFTSWRKDKLMGKKQVTSEELHTYT